MGRCGCLVDAMQEVPVGVVADDRDFVDPLQQLMSAVRRGIVDKYYLCADAATRHCRDNQLQAAER